jgi:acetoacetyl-[acyl-carrier protein] synthase
MEHLQLAPEQRQAAFINSKGFGGNNATGLFLSPDVTLRMLEKRWGKTALLAYQRANEQVEAAAADYDAAMDRGEVKPIYHFGEGVLEGEDLTITRESLHVPGFARPVRLDLENPFSDMTD